MTVRYGVGAGSSCGGRTVVYQPEGCLVCLPIKIGEVQLFEVDFGAEVRCNPTRIGCSYDYDEIIELVSISTSPVNVFGSGAISVTLNELSTSRGITRLLVDATDANVMPDEKWSVTVSVRLESGRVLKQCFQVRFMPCGGSCDTNIPNVGCNGPILSGSEATCGSGVYFIGDCPNDTVCVEITPTVDAYYSLDGLNPRESTVPILLNSGTKLTLTNKTDIQNLRIVSVDCNCDICVSVIFRGPLK